jgi:hypothetical protein
VAAGGCGPSVADDGAPWPRVVVDELRADPTTGAPLLALASGRIAVGDELVAVNGRLLALGGAGCGGGSGGVAQLDAAAHEFSSARRPLTLLFRRRCTGGGDGGGVVCSRVDTGEAGLLAARCAPPK